MANFAKIEDGMVTNVIVADQDFIDTQDETFLEIYVSTQVNYAGIGYTYDADNGVFYSPKPYTSWTLNTNTWKWESPITYPDDDEYYFWDEDAYQADNTNGWVVGVNG